MATSKYGMNGRGGGGGGGQRTSSTSNATKTTGKVLAGSDLTSPKSPEAVFNSQLCHRLCWGSWVASLLCLGFCTGHMGTVPSTLEQDLAAGKVLREHLVQPFLLCIPLHRGRKKSSLPNSCKNTFPNP